MARKHIQQMTTLESSFIHGYLRSQKRSYHAATHHFYDRASDRVISLADAERAIRTGRVVEVHNDRAPSMRVLVRDAEGICVVVELGTDIVITAYYNAPDDQHETLNWAPYRWTQDVVELVKSL